MISVILNLTCKTNEYKVIKKQTKTEMGSQNKRLASELQPLKKFENKTLAYTTVARNFSVD